MGTDTDASGWTPAIDRTAGPAYLAIADAIAADIRAGRLVPGQRLPPQRILAARLGLDFTTVTRGYAEARRRRLVEGQVGRGTYVRAPPPAPAATAGLIDLSMNLPPPFENATLPDRLWHDLAGLGAEIGHGLLLRYQEPGGTAADRAAGSQWLAGRLPGVSAERVLVCPGAQGALTALAGLLAGPGDAICAEALCYPGFRALAAHLGIRLLPVALDESGIDPDAFEAICRREQPKALYCTPTLHNPTTITWPAERRAAIAAIARRHDIPIIEDDAYGALPEAGPPPLAAFAPEVTWHIAGLAKCLSPALRIAYLAAPDARRAARAAAAVRATAAMTSPLTAALATRWLGDGTADAVLRAIRSEAAVRQGVARRFLPRDALPDDPAAFHLWFRLPPSWSRGAFVARLHDAGIGVVASDAFAVGPAPEAVRIGLGAAPTRDALERGLARIADLADQPPALASTIV